MLNAWLLSSQPSGVSMLMSILLATTVLSSQSVSPFTLPPPNCRLTAPTPAFFSISFPSQFNHQSGPASFVLILVHHPQVCSPLLIHSLTSIPRTRCRHIPP